jgi:large subunit ribosomal protein L1
MSKRSKRYKSNQEKIEQRPYILEEAIKLVKELATSKFDESIEVHLNLGIDPKKSEQVVKGTVDLPHGTGRSMKVAVFTESKEKEAKEAGADLVGGKELVAKIIRTKKTDFSAAIATPDFMQELAKAAKLLGPRGLMPSPKNSTVTDNVAQAIKKLQAGQVNFRNDDSGNIHQVIGKISWDQNKLRENFNRFIAEVKKQKPKGAKGSFIKNVTLCSTMGAGVKITI